MFFNRHTYTPLFKRIYFITIYLDVTLPGSQSQTTLNKPLQVGFAIAGMAIDANALSGGRHIYDFYCPL